MNFYTPTLGLTLMSREQQLAKMYQYLVDSNIFIGSYELFLGSNWHRFLSQSVLPVLEEQQAQFVQAQADMFTFWQDNRMHIKGSHGASYEGFIQLFQPHTTSIHLVTMKEDTRLKNPGELSIYFDNLQIEPLPLRDLFRKAMPLACFTPLGDYTIEVNFTNANSQTYRYFNLLPSDYTALDLRIHVSYKQGLMRYSTEEIITSVREEFDHVNRIGRSFYPYAYFNHAKLPNLASMRIESLVEGSTFIGDVRKAELGQKFILQHLEVLED